MEKNDTQIFSQPLFRLPLEFGYPADEDYFKSILESRLRYWGELPENAANYSDRLETAIREALRIYEVTFGKAYAPPIVRQAEVGNTPVRNQGNRTAWITWLAFSAALVALVLAIIEIYIQ